eukprot:CAMPEP_0179930482 /NCGR_PEP_ID=MMETSP0983-20121128/10053_1 /TAXON_ID=483367 /ORGANISM="non described non described, Strain CCMP 2436" /LENGTH=38 /DNA_ID= /DNA_START= /DNA_END= /DNA_ORIENTATION=
MSEWRVSDSASRLKSLHLNSKAEHNLVQQRLRDPPAPT